MKRWIGCVLCLCLIGLWTPAVSGLASSELNALSAVVMEASTGRILYEKNAYEERPMASTTKIMTLIVALEEGNEEEMATVSELAASQPKVKMGMSPGEQYRLKDLYYLMMLESWNDTAVVIAEHIGGSVEVFCQMMTEKAREIGAMHTSFMTPNGLDEEGHYTTATDMARIMAYALKNEEFREIVNTESYTMSTEAGNSRGATAHNHNPLLGVYEGINGGKTGYTDEAGLCLVEAAEREGVQLVAVVLGSGWPPHSNYRVEDAKKLLNLGFTEYDFKTLVEAGTPAEETINVAGGTVDYVTCRVTSDFSYYVSEEDRIELSYDIPYSIPAPVQKGDIVGAVSVYVNGTPVGILDLAADQSCERRNISYYWDRLWNCFTFLITPI